MEGCKKGGKLMMKLSLYHEITCVCHQCFYEFLCRRLSKPLITDVHGGFPVNWIYFLKPLTFIWNAIGCAWVCIPTC